MSAKRLAIVMTFIITLWLASLVPVAHSFAGSILLLLAAFACATLLVACASSIYEDR